MDRAQFSRRNFLSNIGRGTAAVGASALLLKAHESFAQELEKAELVSGGSIDVAKLRSQFSLGKDVTYLNHASIGAIPIPVQEARFEYLKICESNPWFYCWSGAWDEAREATRARVSKLLGCDDAEVAITHNTTEFFNTLASGLPLNESDEVLFSSLNHQGASVAFEHVAKQRGYKVRRFEFPMDGANELTVEKVVDLHVQQIRPETKLLVLPHIDNTLGVLHPVKQIASEAKKAGVAYVAVDAAQSVGMIDVDCNEMGIDVFASSPHKWLGAPKGLGVAYVARALQETLRPMWVTWGQKSWSDSARKYEDYGTRNLAEVLTLGDAIRFHSTIKPALRENRLKELWKYTQERAKASRNGRFNSPFDTATGSVVMSIELLNAKCNRFAKAAFDDHQIVVRPFKIGSQETIRVSPNVYTSESEIDKLFSLIDA